MGLITWKTLFHPTFEPGGLSAVQQNVSSKLFEDFEDYANDTAVQAVWTEGGGAANPTLALTTNAVRGDKSIESAITVSTGTLTRSINQNNFGWGTVGAGGRLRYIVFKGMVTTGTGAATVRLSDASDANHYKEWGFTLSTDILQDYIIDLYSGTTTGYRNSEGFPGPTATGATTWDPDLIDTFAFRDLAVGSTYRFDDIRFYYEYSVLDAIGFGTETATAGGVDGSIHSKLRTIDEFHDVPAADSADNAVISDVVGNKTDAAAVGAVSTVESIVAYLKQGINLALGTGGAENNLLGTKVTFAAADVLDGVQNALFTVSGGRVLITHLEGEVTVAAVDVGANNTQFLTNPTVGTDQAMCAVLDINGDELGTIYTITGEPATAMQGGSGGGAPGMVTKGFVVPEGTITIKSAADGGVGGALFASECWYMPLDAGATVVST